jgi:hypothetical protein
VSPDVRFLMETPRDGQRVEIFVGGQWVPAIFCVSDSVYSGDPDHDEIWWMDHYQLEDGGTIPEDVHSTGELPEWRPI